MTTWRMGMWEKESAILLKSSPGQGKTLVTK